MKPRLSLPIVLMGLKEGEVFFSTRALRRMAVDKDWPRDLTFWMETKKEPVDGQEFKIVRYVDAGVVATLVAKPILNKKRLVKRH